VQGPFKRFDHDHFFEYILGATLMRDVFDYDSPLGILGRLADRLFLEAHMTALLEQRNKRIKQVAEAQSFSDV
jgi:ligand-binding SRPBCC domain-containing protein